MGPYTTNEFRRLYLEKKLDMKGIKNKKKYTGNGDCFIVTKNSVCFTQNICTMLNQTICIPPYILILIPKQNNKNNKNNKNAYPRKIDHKGSDSYRNHC
jgi:hypothetical protein